jgi:hypothetical protein
VVLAFVVVVVVEAFVEVVVVVVVAFVDVLVLLVVVEVTDLVVVVVLVDPLPDPALIAAICAVTNVAQSVEP